MDIAYGAGLLLGVLVSPAVAVAAAARRARVFHPTGLFFAATVEALPEAGGLARLAGPALVRFSGGAHKGFDDKKRDIIGLTVRFGPNPGPLPQEGDQDLIFGNFKSAATVGAEIKQSNSRDLLDNTYFTASTLRDPELGRVSFRLTTEADPDAEGSHGGERLRHSVTQGRGVFDLAVRVSGTGDWRPVARLTLNEPVEYSDESSAFSPFTTGLDLVPDGLVGGLRRVAYAVSQSVRGAYR